MATTNNTRYRKSNFTRWGKWVLIGVLVAAAILALLLICCCVVLRRHKKSKAAKNARDSEAGAYNKHDSNHNRSEKFYQPPTAHHNTPAAVAPVHTAPVMMQPIHNNQPLAHDFTTVDQGRNTHDTHHAYNNNTTNGYQSQTIPTQGGNYYEENQRAGHGNDRQGDYHVDNQRANHGYERGHGLAHGYGSDNVNVNGNGNGNGGFAQTASMYEELPARAPKYPDRY